MSQISPCFFTARDDGKYVVSYEIGNACNMNCKHCMNKSTKEAYKGLPGAKVKELLKELADNGVQYLYVSGGEPLIHPDFDEIIKSAYDYGFQMMLATNGLEIPNHIETIEKYVSDVSISLDGIGDLHDEFRGTPGAFEKVLHSIEFLNSKGIYTRISTCIWKKSAEQLEQIAEWAEKHNLKKINFSILVPTGRTTENDIQIPWEQYPQILERVEKLRKTYAERGTVEIVLRRSRVLDESSIDCIGGEYIFHIDAHGRISPCSWCSKSDKDNCFSMQWEGGNMAECIAKCKELQGLLEKRKEKYGYTGCPAIAYFQNGSFMKADPINQMLKGKK